MITVYVDANILLNVWRKEEDPKTGKELWKGSSKILEKIELGKLRGVMGLTTVMEILHAIRVWAIKTSKKEGEDMVEKAINKLKSYEIEFIVPTDIIMSDSFTYFLDYQLDPYDSIAVSTAVHEGAKILISRDKKLKKKIKDLIEVKEPEEIDC